MATLLGNSRNDVLDGTAVGDTIADGAGDDYIAAGSGDDTITGGTGNDWYEAGAGTDTLSLSAGFGLDVVDIFTNAGGPPYGDNLKITDIYSENLFGYRTGNQYGLANISGSDNLTILDFFSVTPAPYGTFSAPLQAGGTEVDTPATDSDADGIPDVQELPLLTFGTSSSDTITTTSIGSFENWAWGGLGDDSLTSTANAAMLFGGGGNDTLTAGVASNGVWLIGGSGADTYVVGSGDIAFITDAGSSAGDTLIATSLGFNDPDTFALTIDNQHLMVFNQATGTIIFLVDWQSTANQIESVQLSDGTYTYAFVAANIFSSPNYLGNFTWEGATGGGVTTADFDTAVAQLREFTGDDQGPTYNLTIGGTSAGETLTGFSGDNTLIGDTGNDILRGMGGNDIYVFRPGDGQDTVDNITGASNGETNTLRFGAGIRAGRFYAAQSGNDLLLSYNQSGTDRVTLTGWYGANANLARQLVVGTSDSPVMPLLTPGMTSSSDAEMLVGTNGSDAMDAGGGADWITPAGGDDTVVGGTAVQTVAFAGPRGSYSVARSGTMVTVTDLDGASNGGDDGTDTLTSIELLHFSDTTISLNRAPSDFDADGSFDYLWRNTSGDLASWHVDSAAHITGTPYLPSPSPDWNLVAIADFNSDGRADYAWRNANTGAIAEWSVDESAIITYRPFLPGPSSDWNLLGTADFDGDGRADFLWRNADSGNLAEWYVDENALITASPYLPGPSPDWSFVGNGDFNGDGRADFLWRNASLNVLAIWQVDSTYHITSSNYIPGPSTDWTFKTIADLNGDGKSDLLWQNSVSGALSPWYMNGLDVGTYAPWLPGPSSDWQLVAAADVNGDDRADYVWQSTAKGALATWSVDPATGSISASPYLPAPSADWTLKTTLVPGQVIA